MREKYETGKDLDSEQKVATYLQLAWDCHAKKMPPGHAFDYCIEKDGGIKGMVEIKCRSHKYGAYPDVMLSMIKLIHARSIHPLPVFFVVRWTDRMGWVKLQDQMLLKMEWGGRTTSTRDKWDIEPVTKIPLGEFKLI